MDSTDASATSTTRPTACIIIGMAGSGKTTLLQRINAHVHQHEIPSYVINLDPAVAKLPYGANIDIRDTVNYKEVMKQYQLGPNGGILTSLNLYSTKFNQVLNFVDKKSDKLKYVFMDTPGQIEIFTWSASGTIITESLAASYPTVIIFVVDTPRTSSPITFMSNMMYACSIMYKSKLPFLVVFNKIDVCSHEFAEDWMKNPDRFEEALRDDESYMASLVMSMGTTLGEFYRNITTVGVSAVTGLGMDRFFTALEACTKEYYDVYLPMVTKEMEVKKAALHAKKQEELKEVQEALSQSQKSEGAAASDATEQQQYEELMKYVQTATSSTPASMQDSPPRGSESQPATSSAPSSMAVSPASGSESPAKDSSNVPMS